MKKDGGGLGKRLTKLANMQSLKSGIVNHNYRVINVITLRYLHSCAKNASAIQNP